MVNPWNVYCEYVCMYRLQCNTYIHTHTYKYIRTLSALKISCSTCILIHHARRFPLVKRPCTSKVHCPERNTRRFNSIPSVCHKIRCLPAFSLSAQWLNLIRLATPHYQIFNARAFCQVSINHPLYHGGQSRARTPQYTRIDPRGQSACFFHCFFPASPHLTSRQQSSKHHVSESMFTRSIWTFTHQQCPRLITNYVYRLKCRLKKMHSPLKDARYRTPWLVSINVTDSTRRVFHR